MLTTLAGLLPSDLAVAPLRRWAVSSQQRARRNAMLAATECATRRAVRDEVDSFLVRTQTAVATVADVRQIAAHG